MRVPRSDRVGGRARCRPIPVTGSILPVSATPAAQQLRLRVDGPPCGHGPVGWFRGDIDQIRAWGPALSDTDVRALV
jgi:hypothetical protein